MDDAPRTPAETPAPDPLLRIEIYGPPELLTTPPAAPPAPRGDTEDLLDAGMAADVRRRERKLRDLEAVLQDRLRDLDEREVEVDRREIELEAAFGLRENRVEAREAELAALDQRLRRKEDDLARYVGQVQARLALS